MKANLIYPGNIKLSGYENIETLNHANLDQYIEDAEAEEIRAYHILSHFPYDNLENVLSHWINKIKRGGTLNLVEYDIGIISNAYPFGSIEINDLNKIIFGHNAQSVIDAHILMKHLRDMNLKIIFHALEGMEFNIKGIKQ